MNSYAEQIYQHISKAVETDQIRLPSLPEVALRVKEAVEKDSHTAEEIADILSQDGALSARLLQLANSPLYRSLNKIDNLQMAITRLGLRIVKDLVVMLAIKQAFKGSTPAIDEMLRSVWQTSVDVAAHCRVLAKSQSELNAEQAILAGLIHNIGSLPVIELANRQPELFTHITLQEAICELQPRLGEKILSFWLFPESLIEAASSSFNFSREQTQQAEYVDLVQVALLHTIHPCCSTPDDWSTIPAITQLGLDPEMPKLDEQLLIQVEETRSSLMQI